VSASPSVVVDAGLMIALLDSDDAHHDWAVRVLADIGPGCAEITALTLAEALVHPAMAGRADRALGAIRRLGVAILPLTEDDALSLAELRAASGLRMPDAVVLHAASRRSAALATSDRVVARAAKRAGSRVYAPFPVAAEGEAAYSKTSARS
jgi:predicted nucleic acid-binding protein